MALFTLPIYTTEVDKIIIKCLPRGRCRVVVCDNANQTIVTGKNAAIFNRNLTFKSKIIKLTMCARFNAHKDGIQILYSIKSCKYFAQAHARAT